MKYFQLPYEIPISMPKLSKALRLVDKEFVSKIKSDKWSKRTAKKKTLFSDNYITHRDTIHFESSEMEFDDLLGNNYSSYLLRDGLENVLNLEEINTLLLLNKNLLSNKKRHNNLIVTSGGYTIPFHLDQYDSLIFAVKNTRVIFLIDNFEELYRESEIELFSNSYVPNSFKERAVIKKITLNEGYGIFVKRLQPHAVKTLIKDDYTIAYTHCVQEEFDILKKVERC